MQTVSDNGSGYQDCGGGSSVICPVPAGYYFSVSPVGDKRAAVKHFVFDIQLGVAKPVPSIDEFVSNPEQNTAKQCWIIKGM